MKPKLMLHQPRFKPVLDHIPVFLFGKLRFKMPQFSLGRAHNVECFAVSQKINVGFTHHPAIHHPDALRLSETILHFTHHILHGGHVDSIAVKDLVVERQTFRCAHKPDTHQLAIGSLVPAVTTGGLCIAKRLPLKIRATSGLLSARMGGRGTMPYQPENIWEVVGLGTEKDKQDRG